MGWQGAGVLKNLCQNPTPAKDCRPVWTQRPSGAIPVPRSSEFQGEAECSHPLRAAHQCLQVLCPLMPATKSSPGEGDLWGDSRVSPRQDLSTQCLHCPVTFP